MSSTITSRMFGGTAEATEVKRRKRMSFTEKSSLGFSPSLGLFDLG
jgi:hypothetical protein